MPMATNGETGPARTVLTHLPCGVDVRDPAPSRAKATHDGMMLAVP